MNITAIINKKKNNLNLSKEEIDFVIDSFATGKIGNRKIIEFMKIINEKNFSYEETYFLADAIASTGEKLKLDSQFDLLVDKHSAGLISDASTLIFLSVLAALDVKCVKVISPTYGNFSNTYEKLHVISGFSSKITKANLIENINKCGIGVIETYRNFADVDKKLYDLRIKEKITSIPLIAASILSKMFATGANVFVFDVKSGEGAIGEHSSEYSNTLAEYLVHSSKLANKLSAAVVTNLDQPISTSIGNHAELLETINILSGKNSAYKSRLLAIAKELTIEALILSKKASGRIDAEKLFDETISSKKALEKFHEMIELYGGNINSLFEKTTIIDGVTTSYLTSNDSGYIEDIKISKIKDSLSLLSNKNNKVKDDVAGVEILKREGDKVSFGDKLARITYSIDNKNFFSAKSSLYDAFYFTNEKPKSRKLFYNVIV